MAERRLLSKNVIYQDQLADLPHTAQILYLYLNLEADDDGFVANPRMVICMARADKTYFQLLLDKGYLLAFDSGVVVITHWHIHNQIRKDRYKPTRFSEEWKMLEISDSGCYIWAKNQSDTNGIPTVSLCEPQDKISKDKINKDKLNEDKIDDTPQPAVSSSSSYNDYENLILTLYQTSCPSLPQSHYLSEDIRKNIAQLQAAGYEEETLKKAFQIAENTNYLKGGGRSGWKASLPWLCKKDNLEKVINGFYQAYKPDSDNATVYGATNLGEAELEAIQKLLREDDPKYQLPALQS